MLKTCKHALLQRLEGEPYMIKERRISKPSHVKELMAEQINILRKDASLDPVERARAIPYLSNTALSAYKEGEAAERLDRMENMLKEAGLFR